MKLKYQKSVCIYIMSKNRLVISCSHHLIYYASYNILEHKYETFGKKKERKEEGNVGKSNTKWVFLSTPSHISS